MPTLHNWSHSNTKDAWKTFLSFYIYWSFFSSGSFKSILWKKRRTYFIHIWLLPQKYHIHGNIEFFFKKAMQFSGVSLNFNRCFYVNQHTNRSQGIPKLINRTSWKHTNIEWFFKKNLSHAFLTELEIWRNKILL